MTSEEILGTVERWAFQPESYETVLDNIDEDSTLSYVRTEPPASYLEIVNGFMQSDLTGDDESVFNITTVRPRMENQQRMIYEGLSYRVEMVEIK